MKIAIIGGGYVGLHTAIKLAKTNIDWKIDVLDVDEEKIKRFNRGESPIDDFFMSDFMSANPGYLKNIAYSKPKEILGGYDIFFIALSTNPKIDNVARLNTDLIFKYIRKMRELSDETTVIVRSTVNIDDHEALDELKCGYWPEFLSQGVETVKNIEQDINVISLRDGEKTSKEIFEKLFEGKQMIKLTTKEAIFAKVMHNTLDAHLINLTNLFANISEENEINFYSTSKAVESLLLKRNKMKKPGIGYGGSCYPKDSYSLIEITSSDQNKKLIQSLEDFNNEQSKIFLTKEKLIREAKNILVLGSSFKGGTNDITRTPTKALRSWLIKNDIDYKIWEPMISNKWSMEGEVISVDIEKDIIDSDLIIVASDWEQFNNLLLNYKGDVIDLKSCVEDNGKMKLHKIGLK